MVKEECDLMQRDHTVNEKKKSLPYHKMCYKIKCKTKKIQKKTPKNKNKKQNVAIAFCTVQFFSGKL